ncbi:beta-xylosidase [Bacillus subtilis]|nr:beta-xylosidase [Bacillus subtilis]
MKITNPVLKGFNPDPSICRAGEDYYIAVSTFEWFPGVQIHHSKDLVNWHLVAHPLQRVSQLDMKGNPNSGGVWAPCLSYSDGKFWLIYTDVKVVDGAWKDCHNYLVTCETINGDWSEPITLNSSGFDASLFHDKDGKKYLLNMLWDHRIDRHSFGGIVIQEYSDKEQKLIGKPKVIFEGTDRKLTEAPHLYHIGNYYYLLTAEGGTRYEHAATIARSANIEGPYEVHPDNPILTSWHDPGNPLQKCGHASIVQTHTDEWYLAHLTGRPIHPDDEIEMLTEKFRMFLTEDAWLWIEGIREEEFIITLLAKLILDDSYNFKMKANNYRLLRGMFENKLITEKITEYRKDPRVITHIQEMIDKEKNTNEG